VAPADYGLVLIVGLFAAGDPDINFLPLNAADDVLHLVSSLAGAAIARWPAGRAIGQAPADAARS
jgi:hypothetical protein